MDTIYKPFVLRYPSDTSKLYNVRLCLCEKWDVFSKRLTVITMVYRYAYPCIGPFKYLGW